MPDPIAEVQALVGCPHEWGYVMAGYRWKAEHECKICDMLILKHDTLPTPAPDCATTDGALRAANKLLYDTQYVIGTGSTLDVWMQDIVTTEYALPIARFATEREAATAICELILQATKGQDND